MDKWISMAGSIDRNTRTGKKPDDDAVSPTELDIFSIIYILDMYIEYIYALCLPCSACQTACPRLRVETGLRKCLRTALAASQRRADLHHPRPPRTGWLGTGP